jgi:hypothetical protein
MILTEEGWRYADTGESYDDSRPCGYCGRPRTPEGYDSCIGYIPEAIAACCGHGTISEAYVLFEDGRRIPDTEEVPST